MKNLARLYMVVIECYMSFLDICWRNSSSSNLSRLNHTVLFSFERKEVLRRLVSTPFRLNYPIKFGNAHKARWQRYLGHKFCLNWPLVKAGLRSQRCFYLFWARTLTEIPQTFISLECSLCRNICMAGSKSGGRVVRESTTGNLPPFLSGLPPR